MSSGFRLDTREKARANGPSLPKNMVNIIMIFPEREREEVIPVDNPTVPIAEISSKKVQ